MSDELTVAVSRELQLGGGETIDIIRDGDALAAYLDDIDDKLVMLKAERERVETAVMQVMDAATMSEIPVKGGEIEKDPPGHTYSPQWDDQILARLFDYAPDDPELAATYKRRLVDILRPEYVYRPLTRELWKLAKERPELEGIIADAEIRKPKPRHVRVTRRSR